MPRFARIDKPPSPPPPPASSVRHQLLNYTPHGPLGGTFSCPWCGARAWHPDLMDHAPNCAYCRSPAVP